MKSAVLTLMLFLIAALEVTAGACTGVEIGSGDQVTVAQNIGWFWKLDAAMVVNMRSVAKFGIKNSDIDVPAQWTSKYGSVSFTTVGREFPISGVNEKGLTVQGLHSYDGRYETSSGLSALGEFQWVQYQLDLSASIDDAISNAKLVRPTDSPQLTLHFLICEASGQCAVFQWLDGKMDIRSGEDLPVKAFTNSEYGKSVAAFQNCIASNCNPPDDPPLNSLKRFIQAAGLASSYDGTSDPSQYLFQLTSVVAQSTPLTLWSVVIHNAGAINNDPLTLQVSAPGGSKVQFVDLKKLDFSCAHPAQMQLVDLTQTGDVATLFKDYDPALQKLLGQESRAPADKQEQWLNYPGQTICVAP